MISNAYYMIKKRVEKFYLTKFGYIFVEGEWKCNYNSDSDYYELPSYKHRIHNSIYNIGSKVNYKNMTSNL